MIILGTAIRSNTTKRKGCYNCSRCFTKYDYKWNEWSKWCAYGKRITANKLNRGCTKFERIGEDV